MTTTDTEQLFLLNAGDTFTYQGTDYVLVDFNRTRAKIARLSDSKNFVLAMNAKVLRTGRDTDALATALSVHEARAEARAEAREDHRPTLRPGTKVRFVSMPATVKAGLVGQEAVITRTNTKTYTLSNGYRVTPGLVEVVA